MLKVVDCVVPIENKEAVVCILKCGMEIFKRHMKKEEEEEKIYIKG